MRQCLRLLGVRNPNLLPVSQTVKDCLSALTLASQSSALSFASVIWEFEGLPYTQRSSLVEHLESLGTNGIKAAKLIDLHKKINQSEGHCSVAVDLGLAIGAVAPEEVLLACRLSAIVARSIAKINDEITSDIFK